MRCVRPPATGGGQVKQRSVVGRGLRRRETEASDKTAVTVVLLPDVRFSEGPRVWTTFPTSPTEKLIVSDLGVLLGAILNQDWTDDYPTVWLTPSSTPELGAKVAIPPKASLVSS